jgi:hypothetical protein
MAFEDGSLEISKPEVVCCGIEFIAAMNAASTT